MFDYEHHKGVHRPVTLVFAEEKTTEEIKEARFARRTVVWFKNMLLGRQADLLPLLYSSIKVSGMKYQPNTVIAEISITNLSNEELLPTYMLLSYRLRRRQHSITSALSYFNVKIICIYFRYSFEMQNKAFARL